MSDERKLWLWKNFIGGRQEYWAFDNPYPCYPNGDPMVLGEPCGYALVKESTPGGPAVKRGTMLYPRASQVSAPPDGVE